MSTHAQLVTAFNTAWDLADVDALMDLMCDEPVYHASIGSGPGATHCGRNEVRQAFEAGTAAETAVEAPPLPLHEPIVAAETVIGRWSYHGRAADGRPVVVEGVDIFEFEGDRIASIDAYRKVFPTEA